MKCPACNTVDLVMSERAGIEIDYCPKCRGIWLDRGELDKIVQRSAQDLVSLENDDVRGPARSAPQQHQAPPPPPQYYGKPDDSHYGYTHHHPHQRRRKNWLSELFD